MGNQPEFNFFLWSRSPVPYERMIANVPLSSQMWYKIYAFFQQIWILLEKWTNSMS